MRVVGPLVALLAACGASEGHIDTRVETPTASTTTPPEPDASCANDAAAWSGPAAYTSVDDALADATADATIHICAGTWQVSRTPSTGRLTVQSDSGDAETTILTPAGGVGTILNFLSSETVTVSALTLQGATESALSVASTPHLAVIDCIFRDNTSTFGGGAIAGQITRDPSRAKNLDISGTTFENNSAPNGGAIELLPGEDARLFITASTFTANAATAGNGGAIHILPGTGVETGFFADASVFEGNTATGDGGAVALNGPGEVGMVGSTFTDNTADNKGAAVAGRPPTGEIKVPLALTEGVVSANTAGNLLSGALDVEPGWRLLLDRVDLGADPTDNAPNDIAGCLNDYEGQASLVVDPFLGEWCEPL